MRCAVATATNEFMACASLHLDADNHTAGCIMLCQHQHLRGTGTCRLAAAWRHALCRSGRAQQAQQQLLVQAHHRVQAAVHAHDVRLHQLVLLEWEGRRRMGGGMLVTMNADALRPGDELTLNCARRPTGATQGSSML